MNTIVLASNNKHKIEEFKKILNNYEILSLKDIGFTNDIIEDGNTFEENALIKAKSIYNYLKEKELDYMIIAEDSGLCCESLNNAPGIYSARYSKDHNDQANRDKVIKELQNKDKKAFFVSGIILLKNNNDYQYFEGKTYGKIIDEERGSKDFGYDCIFLSDDLNKTFGEATNEEKNKVSHRARAIKKLVEYLKESHN